VFLVSLVATTLYGLIDQFINWNSAMSLGDITLLIAQSIAAQATYFMNFTMNLGIIAQTFYLLHLVDIFYRYIGGCCASTPREKAWIRATFHYPLYIDLSQHTLIFLITLTYASIAPLILVFGLSYMCLSYFYLSFTTAYVTSQNYDGFGDLFPAISNRIIASLVIYHAVLGVIFLLKQFYQGVVVMFLCFLATILFAHYTSKYFSRFSEFGIIEDVVNLPELTKTNGEEYKHPGMLDASSDLEDINRFGCYIPEFEKYVIPKSETIDPE